MSGGYQCRWCGATEVVPSLVRDHEKTCPKRPEETK